MLTYFSTLTTKTAIYWWYFFFTMINLSLWNNSDEKKKKKALECIVWYSQNMIFSNDYNLYFRTHLREKYHTIRVCLIDTRKKKIKIKIGYFCEKLKNKLRHVMRWYSFLWVDIFYLLLFLVEKFSSSTIKENFFMKKITN